MQSWLPKARGAPAIAKGRVPCQGPKAKSDIANFAVRIFLHDMGLAYDEERGLEPYKKGPHFQGVQDFFQGRCCYCGREFDARLTGR